MGPIIVLARGFKAERTRCGDEKLILRSTLDQSEPSNRKISRSY